MAKSLGLALLLPFSADALVSCHNGNFCPDGSTCVSEEPGAGLEYGCAPFKNAVICDDGQHSCPSGMKCALMLNKCFHDDDVVPMAENTEASDHKLLGGRPHPPFHPPLPNKTFCEIVGKKLPARCECENKLLGGQVNCTVGVVQNDTIGIIAEVLPCTPHNAHMAIKVYDTAHGFHAQLAGIGENHVENIPIPGASVEVPQVGDLGVDVSVKLQGDLSDLSIYIGLNACTKLGKNEVCASKFLPKVFPVNLLHGTFSFSDLCKKPTGPADTILV